MNRDSSRGASLRFVLPALLVYVLLGLFLAIHHEAWRDEADAWLLARDGSMGEIWDTLGYKGTPGLWTLILVPFARAGLPFEAAGFVHVVVAAGAAFVLLRFAPFSRLIKCLLLFSYFLGYEYLAIARNYAIGILLLFLLAALDGARYRRPLAYGVVMGLLANCNVHSLFIATALGLTFLGEAIWQKRLNWRLAAGFTIALGLGLLAVIQVWPPADGAHGGLVYMEEWRAFRWSVSQSVFPAIRVGGLHWAAFPVFGVLIAVLGKHRRALVTFALGWAGLLYIMTFKVVGGTRHFGLVLMLLVWALWVSGGLKGHKAGRLASVALGTVLAAGVITAGYHWVMEYRLPFSGAKDVSSFLESSGLAGRRTAVHLPATGSAVLAYLGEARTFWYPALGDDGSFMRWDRRYKEADQVSHAAVARIVAREDPNALLLLNEPLANPDVLGYRLLYESGASVFEKTDEIFYLYEGKRVRRSPP